MYWKAVHALGLLAERLKNGVISEPLLDEQTSLPVEASHFTSRCTLSPSSVMLPLPDTQDGTHQFGNKGMRDMDVEAEDDSSLSTKRMKLVERNDSEFVTLHHM